MNLGSDALDSAGFDLDGAVYGSERHARIVVDGNV